ALLVSPRVTLIRQTFASRLVSHLLQRLALLLLVHARRQRLRSLGPVPVDRDSLETHLPRVHIGLHYLVHRHTVRHVDSLRYGSGDEGLDRAHHLHMSHVMYASRSFGRLESTV